MNRMIKITLVALVALISVSACRDAGPDPASPEAWQAKVDAIKILLKDQPLPDHFTNHDADAPDDEAVFDPNQLVEALENLQLKPGYQLDFVYYYDGGQGFPYLYARQADAPALQSVEDYLEAIEDCNRNTSAILCSPMDAILTDGTEASFFQWVLLNLMGDQFYLVWHANYHDEQIIASKDALADLVTHFAETQHGIPMTSDQQTQALAIDPQPVVIIEENQVTVRVIQFTKWGGFYEARYVLSPDAPHQVIHSERENLVPYDIGIQF